MISLPLKSHRVRFKTYPFTFTTEEALQNMASLRLTQTNRMDDPKVHRFNFVCLIKERWPHRYNYYVNLVLNRKGNGEDNWFSVCPSPTGGSGCGWRKRIIREGQVVVANHTQRNACFASICKPKRDRQYYSFDFTRLQSDYDESHYP